MSDIFMKLYTQLTDENKEKIFILKSRAEELHELMNIDSREMNIAKTNLETAIMWAVKAIAFHDKKENQ